MRILVLLLGLMSLSACTSASVAPVAEAAPAARATAAPTRTPLVRSVPTATPTMSAVPSPTPTPTPTPVPTPIFLDGEPAPQLEGELAMQTYSLDLYRLPGALSAETIRNLALPAESSIITGSQELNAELTGRIAVRFEPAQSGACAIRGLTLSNERTIRLFYEPNTDPNRILAILAHEFFHQLQHDYYGEYHHRRSDVILLEGMAVWGSRAYFRDEQGRYLYQERAKQALREGRLLPLTTSLEADCRTTTRNDIYNEWASFVEYLLTTYGREKLDAVYRDSTGRPAGSANYLAVYGKRLADLESEWVDWLWKQL
ncbi:DUF2268 domain-containing protein [Candidatus Gracilibacteria bacterium]|nr:DUF2268 domain-containing protein [Candidatus Gracilibacteria bacterium]